jgi:hypothetical protein
MTLKTKMSTTFTLFNSLMKNTESLCKNGKCKDLSKVEKEDFVKKIKEIDKSTHELIYAIISAYAPTATDASIPYSGSFVESGVVQFNFNMFPPRLKHILYQFLKMHLKSVQSSTITDRSSTITDSSSTITDSSSTITDR